MAKEEYILDGYLFSGQAEYQRAKKEKETIAYLTANTDSNDMKALLKLYNRSVEKDSFQTIIGQQYLYNVRQRLIASRIVSADMLAPIRLPGNTGRFAAMAGEPLEKGVAERYKRLYENAVANRKIKNMLIAVLIIVMIGMIIITATSRYSVFTYFTDYKSELREEIADEMEEWQKELEQREQELDQREKALDQQSAR